MCIFTINPFFFFCFYVLVYRVSELHDTTRMKLDRENIGKIDGLELLGTNLTHLYLQHVSRCLSTLNSVLLNCNHALLGTASCMSTLWS